MISTLDGDAKRLVAKAKNIPSMAGLNLAKVVTCDKPYSWEEYIPQSVGGCFSTKRILAMDLMLL